jgi:hypothetical protein
MGADALDRRAALVARKEAALKRWPDRSGADFEAELSATARELEQLAHTLDRTDIDPVERLRTWCSVGEAYMSLGANYALQCATDAFRAAEVVATQAQADALELVHLKRNYGVALLKLAADTNAELAAEAASRLSAALSLARKHMPVGVVGIKYELFRAEHTVTELRGPRSASRSQSRALEEAA